MVHTDTQMNSSMAFTRSKMNRAKPTFGVTCCLFLYTTCSLELKYKRFRAGNGSSDCIYEIHSTEIVEHDNCYDCITTAP